MSAFPVELEPGLEHGYMDRQLGLYQGDVSAGGVSLPAVCGQSHQGNGGKLGRGSTKGFHSKTWTVLIRLWLLSVRLSSVVHHTIIVCGQCVTIFRNGRFLLISYLRKPISYIF